MENPVETVENPPHFHAETGNSRRETRRAPRGGARRFSTALDKGAGPVYNKGILKSVQRSDHYMKHIQTLETRDMAKSLRDGGCGECQTSCQSACKTSCGIANQPCEKADN